MRSAYSVLVVLFTLSTTLGAQWNYTTLATTHDYRPCLTDCIDDFCLVDWQENRMGCALKDKLYFAPAYKYYTAQAKDKEHEYCLSNCGYFGYEYEWCMTANDKKWDYCNSGDSHVSVYKRPCKEHCDKYNGESYYWCHIEGGSWQICAPPRKQMKRSLPVRK